MSQTAKIEAAAVEPELQALIEEALGEYVGLKEKLCELDRDGREIHETRLVTVSALKAKAIELRGLIDDLGMEECEATQRRGATRCPTWSRPSAARGGGRTST